MRPVELAVLCGTAGDAKLPFGADDPLRLSLDGPGANVHLRIDDLRKTLFKPIPPEILDLIRIAAYVYAADQATARPDGTGEYDDGWRRRLFFRVPILCPDKWADDAVRNALTETLSFLSEDEYHFEFVPGRPDPQLPIAFDETPFDGLVEEVCLFSGGLDSLAGAVAESVVARRKVLLLNHRSTPKVSRRHAELVRSLAEAAAGAAPLHVHVMVNKDRGLSAERTQRSRSFLFASLAAAFAGMIGLDRVRFYENGVVSLNLPLSAQVVGSRATRTTHPRVLAGFARLFGALFGRPFAVENPFLWRTKADIVRGIATAECGPLIGLTISCANTAGRSRKFPHCGVCSQCVDRRFAVLAARQAEHDPADRYEIEPFTGERADSDPRALIAGYLETAREVAEADPAAFFNRFGETARTLRHVGLPAAEAAQRLFDLYQRHAREVREVLRVEIAGHADRLEARNLPPGCLIRLVIDDRPADEPDPPTVGRELLPRGDYVFRRMGRVWVYRFAGGPLNFLEQSIGATCLHRLLSQPGKSVSAVELVQIVSKGRAGRGLGTAGDRLDPDALASYHRRLGELREDEDDPVVAEVMSNERERILDEVRSATGLGGQVRQAADDFERVRKRIGKAVRSTIKAIADDDKAFAAHLAAPRLMLGRHPCYTPPDGITWEM